MNNIFINRFDIKIKYLYLKNREKWSYMYFYHLLLWGDKTKIYEYDGSKSCYDDFIVAFEKTYQSLKKNNWLGAPVKCIKLKNGDIYPIEGAHRIASCLHLNIKPVIEIVNKDFQIYNAEFFRQQGMIEQEIKKVEDEIIDIDILF
jgi:hypothetical protein